jgi:hypothetical protein
MYFFSVPSFLLSGLKLLEEQKDTLILRYSISCHYVFCKFALELQPQDLNSA